MVLNMFHGTIAPLAGAALHAVAAGQDGLLPSSWPSARAPDVPGSTTWITSIMAIAFLLIGDPWADRGGEPDLPDRIAMPNVAVWLLRRNIRNGRALSRTRAGPSHPGPDRRRGLGADHRACFEQFGLPPCSPGSPSYSGSALYAIRQDAGSPQAGLPLIGRTLPPEAPGAMLAVLLWTASATVIAVDHVPTQKAR